MNYRPKNKITPEQRQKKKQLQKKAEAKEKEDMDRLYYPLFFKNCGHQSYLSMDNTCFDCDEIAYKKTESIRDCQEVERLLSRHRWSYWIKCILGDKFFSHLILGYPRRRSKAFDRMITIKKKMPVMGGDTLRSTRYNNGMYP